MENSVIISSFVHTYVDIFRTELWENFVSSAWRLLIGYLTGRVWKKSTCVPGDEASDQFRNPISSQKEASNLPLQNQKDSHHVATIRQQRMQHKPNQANQETSVEFLHFQAQFQQQ